MWWARLNPFIRADVWWGNKSSWFVLFTKSGQECWCFHASILAAPITNEYLKFSLYDVTCTHTWQTFKLNKPCILCLTNITVVLHVTKTVWQPGMLQWWAACIHVQEEFLCKFSTYWYQLVAYDHVNLLVYFAMKFLWYVAVTLARVSFVDERIGVVSKDMQSYHEMTCKTAKDRWPSSNHWRSGLFLCFEVQLQQMQTILNWNLHYLMYLSASTLWCHRDQWCWHGHNHVHNCIFQLAACSWPDQWASKVTRNLMEKAV